MTPHQSLSLRSLCTLMPNALNIHVADQIEDLNSLGNPTFNGDDFYQKTHVTGGLKDLLRLGLGRLAGDSSLGVFHLKQAMGGGKTHLMLALGLAARDPELRQRHIPMLAPKGLGVAKVATFYGRDNRAEFFWGWLAAQLGGAKEFARFWEEGPRAPGENDWIKLLSPLGPVLILMDELPPYFENLQTRPAGAGTQADVAGAAFANLLSAVGKCPNVAVVVSDLAASYHEGGKLIQRALDNARQELGRQEKTIIPVELGSSEVYDILRKRLFATLPDAATKRKLAEAYAKAVDQAERAKILPPGSKDLAEQIEKAYPFHPRLEHIVAMFKENKDFRQTRGLMEMVSRLLKSIWDGGNGGDAMLVGPQHFDFSLPETRQKFQDLARMDEVVAKDIWSSDGSAHAQVQDGSRRDHITSQVVATLLTASLSNSPGAKRGLMKEDLLEYLVSPAVAATDALNALDDFEQHSWYLHKKDGRYYFDRQENLTKLLQEYAKRAPDSEVDKTLRARMNEMFAPKLRSAYDKVLARPEMDEVAAEAKLGRVLVIIDPSSTAPSESIANFYRDFDRKNNLLFLSGTAGSIAQVDTAAREVYAARLAESKIGPKDPQRPDLDAKREKFEFALTQTIRSLYDCLFYPAERPGQAASLEARSLESSSTAGQGVNFQGEDAIIQTLSRHPKKLIVSPGEEMDFVVSKAESILFTSDEANRSTLRSRMAECAGLFWLPPKAWDEIERRQIELGKWEDLGNGGISKQPKPKQISVSVHMTTAGRDDKGMVKLDLVNVHGEQRTTDIHYAENKDTATIDDAIVEKWSSFQTSALKVAFLAVDKSGRFEQGPSVVWTLAPRFTMDDGHKTPNGRRVTLAVAPPLPMRYTVDGSNPEQGGIAYEGPFEVGREGIVLQVAADTGGGTFSKQEFRLLPLTAAGEKTLRKDAAAQWKPQGGHSVGDRAEVFRVLDWMGKHPGTKLDSPILMIAPGSGSSGSVVISLSGHLVDGPAVEAILKCLPASLFPDSAALTLRMSGIAFLSGHDAEAFGREMSTSMPIQEIAQ